ncbi:hypothetical protein JVU11DRAFT_9709 [Chiua virens]|nr:hypothetical protein JVU11DRAFT_9709 [Chiua virens]
MGQPQLRSTEYVRSRADTSNSNCFKTSGSTGKHKEVVHTTGRYLLGVPFTVTVKYAPMADVGWIASHTYNIIYELLANGVSQLSSSPHPYIRTSHTFEASGTINTLIASHVRSSFSSNPYLLAAFHVVSCGPDGTSRYLRQMG